MPDTPDPRDTGLKPCPCCGSSAIGVGGLMSRRITCSSCELSTPDYLAPGNAAAAWNRRAAEATLEASNRALAERLLQRVLRELPPHAG